MVEENSQQTDYDKPWPKSQGVRMAHLALYVLAKVEETGVWNVWSASTYRQPSLNTSAKFNAIIPTLLSCTIRESLERFDCWGMAQVFWNNFSSCYHDPSSLVLQLSRGQHARSLEYHTDGGRCLYTPMCTFYEPIPEDEEAAATKLLAEYNLSDPWGKRRLAVLKSLVYLRDGRLCPLTEYTFKEFASKPSLLLAPAMLCHIVPNYIGSNNKTEPLRIISLFAGKKVAEVVRKGLNSLGNVINLDISGSMIFDKLLFGIEALEEDDEMHYYFRLPPSIRPPEPGTSWISGKPNARLAFGAGPHGKMLGGGPNPKLCNLHWAIVKVMSAAHLKNFRNSREETCYLCITSMLASTILQWKGEQFPDLNLCKLKSWMSVSESFVAGPAS